jgi:signal transduction histidine kinase
MDEGQADPSSWRALPTRALQGLLGPGWGGRRAFSSRRAPGGLPSADAPTAAAPHPVSSATRSTLAAPPRTSNAAQAQNPGLLRSPNALAAAHARFARAAFTIYLATAAVSFALLIVALVTDRGHDEDQTREQLLLETDVRAQSLAQRLNLLVEELRRLSQRSEVDLRDQDLAPEKSLLTLSHQKSAFFNVGVAILDRRGEVVWSEPEAFLTRGTSFGSDKWFGTVQESRELRIFPVQPDRPDSILYVVSPLVKGLEFTGVLLGAIDLARGEPLSAEKPTAKAVTVVATHDGTVVYPPVPPQFSSEPSWLALFDRPVRTSPMEPSRSGTPPRAAAEPFAEPFTTGTILDGAPMIVAAAPVAGADLVFMSLASQEELFSAPRARLRNRLLAGLSLALAPAVLLFLLLQRSLAVFRRSEEAAVREERLRLLGEAANSIAHEVKNALNGLSMGIDLAMGAAGGGMPPSRPGSPPRAPIPSERRERIVGELRREIQRLSEFTTELMTFSRGVEPRRFRMDLVEFVPKVTGLLRDAAEEIGAEIDVITPGEPVFVDADAALLHAVISNLAGNALDAATAGSRTPRVEVRIDAQGAEAHLTVSDNGRGVSPSLRPRLFEPFQSEKPNGVGIGLALARKIARAHGGDLILHEPAQARRAFPGASFVLTLPLSLTESEDS